MNEKEFMKKVLAVLEKQQNTIKKLAQDAGAPPQKIEPQIATKREADHILSALKDPAKSAINRLEVLNNDVKVQFHPGKATQEAYDSLMATVKELQAKNVLPGQSYSVSVV